MTAHGFCETREEWETAKQEMALVQRQADEIAMTGTDRTDRVCAPMATPSLIDQACTSLALARVAHQVMLQHRRNAWLSLEQALKGATTKAEADAMYERFVKAFEPSEEGVPQ